MATFPRATGALPRLAPPPRFPEALQSWGQSGKGQFRAVQAMGRVWQEVYPMLDTANADVKALIMHLNRALREGILWDVQHPYWHNNAGVGGGTPIVSGADQTGSTLNIEGATPSVTGWLKAGDIISVNGGAVVYDVTEDVDTDEYGDAAIPINPPIFVGQSPADGAAVTIDAADISFKAYITDVQFPDMDTTRYISEGMTVTFREQPQ